jgi:hypothetical protein
MAATVLILVALLTTLQTVPASPAQVKPQKPPCRIDIDNAHISTSVHRQQGVRVVIVKARSICNIPQQKVLLTVLIYKKEFLQDHEVTRSETNPLAPTSSGLVVYNNGTTRVCKTDAITQYYGIAFSEALINGKRLYAGRTQSPKTVPLACGT